MLLASELLADLFPDEGGALHRLLIALLDRDEFLLTKFEALKFNFDYLCERGSWNLGALKPQTLCQATS